MSRYNRRPGLVPIILVIVGLVIVVVTVVVFGRSFSGSNSGQNQSVAYDALVNFDDSSKVVMVVRGPIVGNEDFRKYRVEITQSVRHITLYDGYQSHVLAQKSLTNDTIAYEQFVYALSNVGFADTTGSNGDEMRGVCPTGKLYVFDIIKSGEVISEFYTTSCSTQKGNLRSSLSSIKNLFLLQIPDYKIYVDSL